ncbi:MAG: right-handed parallel beta-helix repeat-containing protein, partial [Planctomycetota bacterium]
WFYDRGARRLYVKMPGGSKPGARVTAGYRDYGFYVSNRPDVVVDGLNIQAVGVGAKFRESNNFTLRNTDISHSANYGVSASYASDGVIDACTIDDSGHDGIYAMPAYRFVVTNNQVSNSGVRLTNGSISSLPLSNGNGIELGGDWNYLNNPVPNMVTIAQNTVRNSGCRGISFSSMTATVRNNIVEDSCRVLDDCGAIYTGGLFNNSLITGNILINSYGNADGRPAATGSAAQGLYLDDFTEGVTATGNTVINADNTVQLHRASSNKLAGNTLYGARRIGLWFQEDNHTYGGSGGQIVNNNISGNIIFPFTIEPPVRFDSNFEDIIRSGSGNAFDTNVYGPYTDYVTMDNFLQPSVNDLFLTLSQWRAKGMDVNGALFSPFAIRPYRIASINSSNFIANGTFDRDISGWTQWSSDNLAATTWLANCSISGGCLKFTASNTTGGVLYTSSTFAVDPSKTYLLEFKIWSAADNVRLGAIFRNGSTYDGVSAVQTFTANMTPQRFAFLFQPNTALNNARLDIIGMPTDQMAGQILYLDNVSLKEVTPEYHTDFSADSRILVNKQATPQAINCPDADPARCNAYIDLNGNAISWPVSLAGYSSQIVVWNANPFKDTDRDLIPDSQDTCPNSTQIADVNASGCVPADVAVSMTPPSGPALLGDTLTYSVTVRNNGPEKASGVILTNILPSGMTWVSTTKSQGTCSGTSTVTCNLGSLANGTTATVTVTAKATTAGTKTNSATVSNGVEPDSNPANNTASVATAVLGSCTSSGNNISGTIKRSSGTAISGVSVLLIRTSTNPQCGNRLTTGNNGSYQFTKLANGTYSVTPSKMGCTGFTPPSASIALSGANKTQNFTGACP